MENESLKLMEIKGAVIKKIQNMAHVNGSSYTEHMIFRAFSDGIEAFTYQDFVLLSASIDAILEGWPNPELKSRYFKEIVNVKHPLTDERVRFFGDLMTGKIPSDSPTPEVESNHQRK